jgi:hypothetical protein
MATDTYIKQLNNMKTAKKLANFSLATLILTSGSSGNSITNQSKMASELQKA